jgi:hypothetical protein
MVTLRVNGSEVSVEDESAITQQVNRRRDDGVSVCVQVRIHDGSLNMVLATPQCSGGIGGGRPPNSKEKQVFDLWEKFGLSSASFAGGHVVAFLKQLRKMLP